MTGKKEKFLHQKLTDDLQYLKLRKIQDIYPETLDYAADNDLSLLEVLCTLFGEEAATREERATQARLKRAKLPKQKTLEGYDFTFPTRIPKQKILRLFDCDFISNQQNVVFVGPRGTGKTHLLVALAYTAVQKGISVRFARIIDMLNELSASQAEGNLPRTLRSYTRPSLLVLDELGYLPIDKNGSDLLFQVISSRYELNSVILTTNRPFKEWGQTFNADNTLATALIDRLMHHGQVIVIKGPSYRMKDKETKDS